MSPSHEGGMRVPIPNFLVVLALAKQPSLPIVTTTSPTPRASKTSVAILMKNVEFLSFSVPKVLKPVRSYSCVCVRAEKWRERKRIKRII